MNEEFVKALYESIVEENIELYKELYEATSIEGASSDYWKKALGLYRDLSKDSKEVLLELIRNTMVDTISNMLGIIDGSSTLSNSESEPKLLLDNKDTEGELQDAFLEFVEELKND